MIDAALIKELQNIVGTEYVMNELEDRICYSFDATFLDNLPDVIVQPSTQREVVMVIKLAFQYKVPIVCRGASTGLSGGSVPVQGGIVLDLTRLNRILEVDVVNQRAVLEPGVITQDFLNAVNQAGLMYPPDPASSKMSTIGGNIAECAGGPKGVKYGVTRDYLLGVEVVLPDGSIVTTGNSVDGDMAGPDWTMLFCGSEGTLGVITKIILKLAHKPQDKRTLLATFDHIEDAANTVSTIMASGVIPTTLEIMDNLTIRAVENYLCIGLPVEADAILLIEVDGDPASVLRHIEHVQNVCRQCCASEIKIAHTQEEADALWKARRAISPACGKINPTKISEDATVPRSEIPAMVKHIRDIAERYNLKMVIFGHAGDGNLHPNILSNKQDKAEMKRVEKAVEELFKAALSLGGTLTGEHGIGFMKAPYLRWETGPIGFAAGIKVKDAIDPYRIMNPGKMFDFK